MSHHLRKCSFLLLMTGIFLFPLCTTSFAQETSLVQAEQLFRGGQYENALAVYLKVAGEDRVSAIIGASRTWVMIGRNKEAEKYCREALKEFPGDVRIKTELAEILVITGQSDEALEILETVVELPKASVRSYVQYGRTLELRGRRQAALTYYEKAIDQYNEGLVYLGEEIAMVAVAAWELESFQDANLLFREATRVQPTNFEIQVLWGNLFLEKYHSNLQKIVF